MRDILIHFLDTVRNYEREGRTMIGFDERETEEFVDIYLSEKGNDGWTRCSERLPETEIGCEHASINILALHHDGDCLDSAYFNLESKRCYRISDEAHIDATHWQPLPTPTTEK